MKDYELPTVQLPNVITNNLTADQMSNSGKVEVEIDDNEIDESPPVPICSLLDDVCCSHKNVQQPQTNLVLSGKTFCAIIDTGAEISLISREVTQKINPEIYKGDGILQMIGLTGHCNQLS